MAMDRADGQLRTKLRDWWDFWGVGPNMLGPTLTVKITQLDGPEVLLAVGRRQADRIIAMMGTRTG